MATFAERLKSLRREKGWSQQRLADELDLSKSSVNMYERGEREPGFETMEAIADLFNVDMNYLYGRTDIKIADPIVLAPKKPTIPPGFEPMPKMKKIPLIGIEDLQQVIPLGCTPVAVELVKGAKSPERLLDEVTLFLHQVVSELPEPQQQMIAKSLNRDATLEGRHVLVVEDDIDIAALVAHKLRSAGHDVAQVEDGDAALAAIREQRPDLVVLDWMIPGPDGIAVCETVRAEPELAGTRILMLTAKAQESDFERAFRSGADEYMQKPFSTRELVVRAESILARS